MAIQTSAKVQKANKKDNVLIQVMKTYTVCTESVKSLVFSHSGKHFAVCSAEVGYTVYQVFEDGSDYQFLPGSKSVKTFNAVKKFVDSRTQR